MIYLWPDTRPDAGLGHVTRMDALAEALTDAHLKNAPYDESPLRQSDVLVVDSYRHTRADLDALVLRCTLVVIDDVSPERIPAGSIVVNGGALDSRAIVQYAQRLSPHVLNALLGPRYALIRSAFREVRGRYLWTERRGTFDSTHISGLSPRKLADAMAKARTVITYPSMRGMEAACCGAWLELVPYGPDCAYNLRGLRDLDVLSQIDGHGSTRVAHAIAQLVRQP